MGFECSDRPEIGSRQSFAFGILGNIGRQRQSDEPSSSRREWAAANWPQEDERKKVRRVRKKLFERRKRCTSDYWRARRAPTRAG